MDKEALNEIDRNVGRKIREAREVRGISQSRLAEELDLSFQQLQKYETGKNRVSASRLCQIAKILGQPVSYFFEEPPYEWPETPERDFFKWIRLYKEMPRELRRGFLNMGTNLLKSKN